MGQKRWQEFRIVIEMDCTETSGQLVYCNMPNVYFIAMEIFPRM